MDDITAILRMVERLLVVGFAGLSIILGYRLFFHLPLDKTHEGSIELPGIKVVLSKVGPGIFFSVFGSLVLLQSLHEKIEVTNKEKKGIVSNQSNSKQFIGAIGVQQTVSDFGDNIIQHRIAIIEQLGELNCSLKMLERIKENQVTDTMRIAYHDAKLAMLKSVWDKDWGNIDTLDTAPDKHIISSIFNDTSVDCRYE